MRVVSLVPLSVFIELGESKTAFTNFFTSSELEGVFRATRYPFEHGIDITRYNFGHLMGLADFLGRFARSVPQIDRIAWK